MQPLVAMTRISKRFGAVGVLKNVDFVVQPGEVHALAGENGAGKSTLIKILGGVHTDYEGSVAIGGSIVRLRSPLDAARHGIVLIHQELSLVPHLTVADNLLLGRWPTRFGWIRRRRFRAAARETLDKVGLAVDLDVAAGQLPLATQQLIEIAKAVGQAARVIVMDEPTSALNAPDVELLFARIADLKSRGCGLVYITHKLDEIHRIADRVTVLRDGTLVGSAPASVLSPAQLIAWMVGREVGKPVRRVATATSATRLELRNFSIAENRRWIVEPISLHVRAGEVVGLAGLQGSGNSALLAGIFGERERGVGGTVLIDGQPVTSRTPRKSIAAGIALVTSDRKESGLVLSMPIFANMTLANLRQICNTGWLRRRREKEIAAELADRLHLRAAGLEQDVGTLSGGNQQKVMLAKWWNTRPRVLLLDEPTRGIDVGAKQEIYDLINLWSELGIAILLITSELPELLGLADRIVVLHRGRRTAEFARDAFSGDAIIAAAMGHAHEMVPK